jgi:glycosyltransferase involved in cell wall biosynthesis
MEDCRKNKKTIFFVANVDWFFESHRLPLALYALKMGYDVFLLTEDTGRVNKIKQNGIHYINIPFKRSGTNIFYEIRCILLLRKYYCQYKPDIIHHISIKAALLGSLSAKLSGHKRVINAISGFGYNFTDARNGFVQKIMKMLIYISFSGNFYFILQNIDDYNMMKTMNLVEISHLILIKGSGVNLNIFTYSIPVKNDFIIVLFPARILRDKGVIEFIESAKLIRDKVKGRAKFILAGNFDSENLASLCENELLPLLETGYIEWIGYKNNMVDVYRLSDIVVLPSYREGFPKALMEAASVGRPIVTTDVPGCRECVVNGENGFLVPMKNVSELAKSIMVLIDDENLRLKFSVNSRIIAEREYSLDSVIKKTFDLYNNIYCNSNN